MWSKCPSGSARREVVSGVAGISENYGDSGGLKQADPGATHKALLVWTVSPWTSRCSTGHNVVLHVRLEIGSIVDSLEDASQTGTLIWRTHGVEDSTVANQRGLVKERKSRQVVLSAHVQLIRTFLEQLSSAGTGVTTHSENFGQLKVEVFLAQSLTLQDCLAERFTRRSHSTPDILFLLAERTSALALEQ